MSPSPILISLLTRIQYELYKLVKFTSEGPQHSFGLPEHDEHLLREHFITSHGQRITFIYGTGYHAFSEEALDVFWDDPNKTGGIRSELFTLRELLKRPAHEIAVELAAELIQPA